MDTRELHSIEEARFVLGGISRATIYDLLNSGELPSVMTGRRRFVPAAAIAAFIATSSTTIAPSQVRASGRHRAVQMLLQLDTVAPSRPRRRNAAGS
jgi:excisionase family DNA binding protein